MTKIASLETASLRMVGARGDDEPPVLCSRSGRATSAAQYSNKSLFKEHEKASNIWSRSFLIMCYILDTQMTGEAHAEKPATSSSLTMD
jgi:hypothetical protein